MKIRTCDGLMIADRFEDGRAVLVQPTYGARHEVGLPEMQLLELLSEPEDLAELTGPEIGVPEATVRGLLRIGLLVDAEAPERTLRCLIRPTRRTFLAAPIGNPGAASICIASASIGKEGPSAIRAASTPPFYQVLPGTGEGQGWYDSYLDKTVLAGASIFDCGDIPSPPEIPLEESEEAIRGFVRTCHIAGAFPLILGGNHSVTPVAVSGFSPNPIGVLHLDASADVEHRSPENVVRELLGEEHVKSVVSVGLRGYLPWKEDPLDERHRIITMSEARKLGPEGIVAELSEDIPWYVSLDASSLDPSIAPAASTTIPGGFSYAEIRNLIGILPTRKVIGGDIVELESNIDPANMTARILSQIAVALLASAMETA